MSTPGTFTKASRVTSSPTQDNKRKHTTVNSSLSQVGPISIATQRAPNKRQLRSNPHNSDARNIAKASRSTAQAHNNHSTKASTRTAISSLRSHHMVTARHLPTNQVVTRVTTSNTHNRDIRISHQDNHKLEFQLSAQRVHHTLIIEIHMLTPYHTITTRLIRIRTS